MGPIMQNKKYINKDCFCICAGWATLMKWIGRTGLWGSRRNSYTELSDKKTLLEDKCEERPSEKLTEDLHFNVSWLFNKLLNKQGSVSKSRQCFRVGPLVILLKFLKNRQEKIWMWLQLFLKTQGLTMNWLFYPWITPQWKICWIKLV